jgi:hypothetical protein
MVWRLLLILMAVFWFLPRVLRSLGRPPRSRPQPGPDQAEQPRDEGLANLTRQDISDAEFEEIPPPQ